MHPKALLLKKSYRKIFIIGGERGIRTLESIATLHAFQAGAFNHSATSPKLFSTSIIEKDKVDKRV